MDVCVFVGFFLIYFGNVIVIEIFVVILNVILLLLVLMVKICWDIKIVGFDFNWCMLIVFVNLLVVILIIVFFVFFLLYLDIFIVNVFLLIVIEY